MKKRMLAATLAALMLALTSCAGAAESGSQTNDSTSAAAESVSETAAAETEAPAETTSAEEPEPIKSEVFLPQKEKQVINETPVSYESFGIDKADKTAFKEKIEKETKIPVIAVTTNNEDITSREEYTSCVVDVFNCPDEQIIDEASAGIKVRGNSSAFYGDVGQILKNQVPYRIKFDNRTSMLGLSGGSECKSWVLLKADWDLVRNDFAFRLGRALIGDDAFCSDSTLVHVYVNEEFKGVYLLCEQCQVDRNRVDISKPEEGSTDTNIGYYLELDNYATSEDDNIYIETYYGGYEVTDIEGETREFVPAEYSVKNDVYTQGQVDFIEKYLNNLFKIVYLACEKGEYKTFDENYSLVDAPYTTAQETIEAVMDIPSVVDMYLLYEAVHDYDCGEGSFFMCVDFSEDSKCPKMKFTSPWDFNWAYNDSTERYWAGAFCEKSFAASKGDRSNPWFILLIKQDWFKQLATEKWSALKEDGTLKAIVEDEKAFLEEYRDDLNKADENSVDNAYKLLDGWIANRLYWMGLTFKPEK